MALSLKFRRSGEPYEDFDVFSGGARVGRVHHMNYAPGKKPYEWSLTVDYDGTKGTAEGLDGAKAAILTAWRAWCGKAGLQEIVETARLPNDAEVDAVLAEFDGDPRETIRALLQDVDTLARDAEVALRNVSYGYVFGRRRGPKPIAASGR